MKGCLIAGTWDPDGGSTAQWLARGMQAYWQHFRPPQALHILTIPARGGDWATLWQTYSQQVSGGADPVLLLYPGSLGDGLTPHTTVADLARDWRSPLILTLPLGRQMVSQAVAFAALVRHSQAHLVGFVVFEVEETPFEEAMDLEKMASQVETLTQTPLLGCLRIPHLAEGAVANADLARWATDLNWERLG
ncbi:MAG: AAA family ATPase [Cyanobacteriota bacterium]|nr:AAA family ATPase [Cyanobacteriota bacterium]